MPSSFCLSHIMRPVSTGSVWEADKNFLFEWNARLGGQGALWSVIVRPSKYLLLQKSNKNTGKIVNTMADFLNVMYFRREWNGICKVMEKILNIEFYIQ